MTKTSETFAHVVSRKLININKRDFLSGAPLNQSTLEDELEIEAEHSGLSSKKSINDEPKIISTIPLVTTNALPNSLS